MRCLLRQARVLLVCLQFGLLVGVVGLQAVELTKADERLFEAVQFGNISDVRAALQDGADLNRLDRSGLAPLHYAVKRNSLSIVNFLLKRAGIDSNRCDTEKKLTPLFFAPDAKMIACLVDNGHASVAHVGYQERTPLFHFAEQGAIDCVKELLNRGASVGAVDMFGRTPLHVAAEQGHVTVARLLVIWKAGINALDSDLLAPLHLAARCGRFDVVSYLAELPGIEIDPKSKDGNKSPLVVALDSGRPGTQEVVRLLVAHGAQAEGLDLSKCSVTSRCLRLGELHRAQFSEQSLGCLATIKQERMQRLFQTAIRFNCLVAHEKMLAYACQKLWVAKKPRKKLISKRAQTQSPLSAEIVLPDAQVLEISNQ